MAIILLIETATDVCSVGISINGNLISIEESFVKNAHAAQLQILVETAIKKAAITLNQINAVAISIGPGSYTGLRVGLSAAKGYCFALNIPLIAIDTLESLTYQASNLLSIKKTDYYIPLLDARRMEVYTGVWDASLNKIKEVTPVILDAFSFQDYLAKGDCIIFGSGAQKFKDICNATNLIYLKDVYASVKGMAVIAFHAFQESKFADIAYIEPFYLKDFVGTTPKKLF
jgi:tRNA threonylcarbamoyladenosine biosynthesis protein TsaB